MESKDYIEEGIQESMEPKDALVQMLSKLIDLPKNKIAELLETPPDSKLGDLAFPCFTLSPILKKDPKKIAEELSKKIDVKSPFKEVKVIGPYLNFFLDKSKYANDIILDVEKEKDKYGTSTKFKGKQIIIDMIGLNPNKAGHMGHVRNGCVSDTIARCTQFVGYKTVKQSFVNDMGVPTAMVFYANKNLKSKLPKRVGLLKKEDQWQGRVYELMQDLYEKDSKIKNAVNKLHLELEEGKNKAELLAQRKFAEQCTKAQAETWNKLNCSLDLDIYESDLLRSGLVDQVVEKLKKLGALYLVDEGDNAGCWSLKLSQFEAFKGMTSPDKIIIRSDGRVTYTGKDIAMQIWKFGLVPDEFKYSLINKTKNHTEWATNNLTGKALKNSFNKNTKAIHVVGAEQAYVMQVDYYALKTIGAEKEFNNCYHLPLGLVGFGGKSKISSRAGTSGLTADEIITKAESLALAEVCKRNKRLSKANQKMLSKAIGRGAVRYHLVKIDPTKFVQFDFDEALSFEGNTGPYLQYALVRAKKILKKAKPANADLSLLADPAEFELVKHIASFPQTVEQAAEQYSPHLIANYAHELAQLFSTFYEKCPVLKAEPKLKSARLSLVKAFAQTLKNALNLLGVEAVELM